jgi:hypothetical protein
VAHLGTNQTYPRPLSGQVEAQTRHVRPRAPSCPGVTLSWNGDSYRKFTDHNLKVAIYTATLNLVNFVFIRASLLTPFF